MAKIDHLADQTSNQPLKNGAFAPHHVLCICFPKHHRAALCINLATLQQRLIRVQSAEAGRGASQREKERERKESEKFSFAHCISSHTLSPQAAAPTPFFSLFLSLPISHLFPGVMSMLLPTFHNTFDSIQGKHRCAGMSRNQVHQRSLLFTSERLHDLSAKKRRNNNLCRPTHSVIV